ncbi:MAG: hypothetical protein ACI379_05445 [Nocardioides sp.]|uniref:hypothetical protein n=1 Tax=Nocardioides sp. TaxID=35761 RepID=UPI003F0E0EA4
MSELAPKPEPVAERPVLKPGGPDALADDPQDRGQPRDLDPQENPAVNDVVPDEVAAPDDKDQAPSGDADAEAGATDEPAAGQTAEDGSPEPPA